MEQRVIKFRAWDCFNGVMYYSDNFKSLSLYFAFCEDCIKGGNKLIQMQYTGLKDKNGIEIYKESICQVTKFMRCRIFIDLYEGIKIEWIGKNARVRMFKERIEPIFRNHEITFEVIGNIYENPNLLKLLE